MAIANSTWEFDVREFIRGAQTVWHKTDRYVSCPAFVQGRDIVYVGASRETFKINKDGIYSGAYWISPTLNRDNPKAEYTLKSLTLHYRCISGATTLTVEGSGNGGGSWTNGNHTTLTIAQTSVINRAVQHWDETRGITGRDVRFRISFPSDDIVEIFDWEPELIEGGDLGAE